MLRDRDLVVFSDDWGRHPFSCQHLVARLLPYNRVIWVNSVGYRAIRLTAYDARRAAEKVISWLAPRTNGAGRPATGAAPHVLAPVFLPFGRSALVRRFNQASTLRAVRGAMQQLGFERPVVVTTLPTSAGIADRLDASLLVYYCVDDVTLWPGMHGRVAQELELELLRRADLVVATSERLRRTRRNQRQPTELLTHGVDVRHFRVPPPLPGTLPVALYVGLIDERCDRELLAAVARALPDVRVRIVGTWRVPPGPLAGLPNVERLGPVPYEQLPAVLRDASVLLLPYVLDELAQSINPLKLKEYLATGRPVVATPLPEVQRLDRFVRVAEGAEAFVAATREALQQRDWHDPQRDAFLESESWEAKVEQFSSWIAATLPREVAA